LRRQRILRVLLTIVMVVSGGTHLFAPQIYEPMVPPSLPWPREIVLASGFLEVALGTALLVPRTARRAAWGLTALLIAVFPGNVHMAANAISIEGFDPRPAWLWARLPLQALLVAWAYAFTRPPVARHGRLPARAPGVARA